ncbi:MAG: tRNA (adenosine(37)-N6)-threonylcarbamoyltransferase complex transferase subunit TsaD [Candidatus Gracilibacteria bacterium]|nr:tRNA (adenosine(37)-N6)-threonylcarbamoyltransferase complex transferase subunit TsaD [Candidatus Gracilibacteria bacterium]
MYILAFETSCDDTSIAIFKDGNLIALDTKSQIKEHNVTKGVVPEVAARLHANNIFFVLENVLDMASLKIEEMDYIVCTEKPGLLPSLLVGLTVAKTLAKTLNKPFILIDHIKAHIFANLLERDLTELVFPSICLTVSGGHNEIYLWKSLFELELVGETLDDSAGESFDKVSKMMGMEYPGGPIISKLAKQYDGEFRSIFPTVLLEKNSLDFSFSGLKSAVKREIDRRIIEKGSLSDEDRIEISFEFETTVIEILKYKIFKAAERYGIRSLVLAGGVSANDKLKNEISKKAQEYGYSFIHPKKGIYSQDNAAMVAILAYYMIINNKKSF